MKRIILVLLCLLLIGCSSEVNTGATIESDNSVEVEIIEESTEVELTMIGRASVKLVFDDGRVMYIDPYGGYKNDYDLEADFVLVTHQHTDHNNVDRVKMKEDAVLVRCPTDIVPGKSMSFDNIEIRAVKAYNDNHMNLTGCGFIITYKDIVIYHSGDTSTTKDMYDFSKYDIDYALLCMDGHYNMDPAEAMEVADIIEADAIIPIHTDAHGDWNQGNVSLFKHPGKLVVKPGESHTLIDLDKVDLPFDEAIEEIMKDRKAAIESKDYDLYMNSITTINPYFYNEQERWFQGMIEDHISKVDFRVESTELIDEHTAVAYINQTHMMDRKYDLTYPLLFKYERGQWKDYGYKFEELKTDRFTIKYMAGETRVEEFREMLDTAFDNLSLIYEEKPHPHFEMKLFSDQEMLRQRTIPANMWLFTGWSEPDESLKLFTGHPAQYNGYPGVVQHEVVHHITIRVCNNNLPVWMLEGIAMLDGTAPYGNDTSVLLQSLNKQQVGLTIDELEAIDLSKDIPRSTIYQFYNTSYMYTRFTAEKYGHDELMNLFYEAGKKPFHDSTLNDEFEIRNQETGTKVIEKILGISKEELSSQYLKWLEGTEL